MKYDIFISYCHDNATDVEKITNLFDQNGIEYWIDYKSIRLGKKYQGDIVLGIESSELFLFVYSESSNTSEDQIRELGIASDANKLIIPFMLDNSEWDPNLRYMARSNQGIEVWKTGMDFALKVLLNGIRNHQLDSTDFSMPTKSETAKNSHHPQQVSLSNDTILDLDYDDAVEFMQDGELQDAIHSLQASFENGNGKTVTLFNKVLFQNYGNIDWDNETWEFMEQQANAGHSFAHLAYFYKLLHNKETHLQAAEHLKAARTDQQNGYVFLCEGIAREKGIGMRPNLRSATNRYKQAYEMGITEAGSYYAEMNLNGNSGLKIDKRKAFRILINGYEQDDARSCYLLGSICSEKAYLKVKWDKAVKYYKKAVNLHEYGAWIKLGNLHKYNRFSEDYNGEALSCYLEALKNGIKDAHAYIAEQYWNENRQEDALLEAKKGEKVGNVLSISVLGRFYEEGLQEEGHWIRENKPDYTKAWEYYRKAFMIGGRIEDAVSMARLYVKDEYRPQDISWDVIEDYLKQGVQVPIIEAVELMIEALKNNGREKDTIQYLKIGAESGSLQMMHEYGIYLLSSDNGEALRLIEEAGDKQYRPSVEWLLNYYKTPQTRSENDYNKWMEKAVEMKIEVPLEDYIPYILQKDNEKAKKYLLDEYSDNYLEPLFWLTKYHRQLAIDNQWLLQELKCHYIEVLRDQPSFIDIYADFLIDTEDYSEYEVYQQEIANKNQNAGDYLALLKKVRSEKGLSKALAQSIYAMSNDDTVPHEWRQRSKSLLYQYIGNRDNSIILIVDSNESNVQLLKILLMNEHYQVCTANSGESCLEMAQKEKPTMILMNVSLSDMNGFDVAATLKKSPKTKDTPIVFLLSSYNPSEIHRCYQVGEDYLVKPFNKEQLVKKIVTCCVHSNLKNLFNVSNVETQGKVLIVDDVLSNILLVKILLTNEKFQVVTANNGNTCIEQAKKEHPDAILMDVMMADISGFDAAVILKKDPETRNIPIVFLTALNSPSDLVKGFQVGADDYLTKPFDREELSIRLRKVIDFHRCVRHYFET